MVLFLRQCILSFLYFAFQRGEEVDIEGIRPDPIDKGQLESIQYAGHTLTVFPTGDHAGVFQAQYLCYFLLAQTSAPPATSQAIRYRLHIPLLN